MRVEESKPRLQASTSTDFYWSWTMLIDIYGIVMNVIGLIGGTKTDMYWF